MTPKQALLAKIADRGTVIGICGLGYVGLPLALRFAQAGFRVIGFDIDRAKIDALNAGRSYIGHIGDAPVAAARAAGFEATDDFARAGEADALILCVPTPLGHNREPDLSFILATLESLAPHLRAGQLLSLESTTYPGTTEEELRPRIEQRGFTVGKDFFLVFSPEREDPGNPDFDTRRIPKLCGGSTPDCLEVGVALYGAAIDRVVPVSSTRVAEMAKLLENIHRAVNIGLVNEMKVVADAMGIDIHEVIRAAATKPFGFVPYWPGPGFGGHCIPIDPYYLAWKAKQHGVEARGQSLPGSRILVLGIAYKKNIDDTRESPAVQIMELLVQRGATAAYSDPHVPSFPKMREHRFELGSVTLTQKAVAGYDALVLATDHDAFDYAMLLKHARLIVDARGAYRKSAPNLVRA